MQIQSMPTLVRACSVLLSAGILSGCGGRNESDRTSGGNDMVSSIGAGAKLSPADREAADFVRSKVESCWLKGPDGWTTERQMRNLAGQVMDRVPDLQFHQFREIKFTISLEQVTEAQRLNGTDYRGVAEFESAPQRSYRRVANFDGPLGWSPWEDGRPAYGSLAVERRNGKWLIQDDAFLDGIKPAADSVPLGK